jgi:hypothetical protein
MAIYYKTVEINSLLKEYLYDALINLYDDNFINVNFDNGFSIMIKRNHDPISISIVLYNSYKIPVCMDNFNRIMLPNIYSVSFEENTYNIEIIEKDCYIDYININLSSDLISIKNLHDHKIHYKDNKKQLEVDIFKYSSEYDNCMNCYGVLIKKNNVIRRLYPISKNNNKELCGKWIAYKDLDECIYIVNIQKG